MTNRRVTQRIRRVIAVTILCSMGLVASTGCFGSFTTVKRLYRWNETVDANKWAKWGVFVSVMVVPIYPCATIWDMIFTNSVEFWSGRNPMNEPVSFQTETGDHVSMQMRDDGAVDVAIEPPGQPASHVVVVPEQESIGAYDADGKLIARAVEASPK
jgi:uncharacterized protein DUF3332